MYRESENLDGQKNVGSILSTVVGFQRKLPGLYITGMCCIVSFYSFYGAFLMRKFNYYYICFQVTVWGDYGRIEGKKVFMGLAQIILDDLDLNQMVIGWYKLFDTQALVSGTPSLALSRRSSATSLDSFKI